MRNTINLIDTIMSKTNKRSKKTKKFSKSKRIESLKYLQDLKQKTILVFLPNSEVLIIVWQHCI